MHTVFFPLPSRMVTRRGMFMCASTQYNSGCGAAISRERRILCSALPEMWRLIESSVWSNEYSICLILNEMNIALLVVSFICYKALGSTHCNFPSSPSTAPSPPPKKTKNKMRPWHQAGTYLQTFIQRRGGSGILPPPWKLPSIILIECDEINVQ